MGGGKTKEKIFVNLSEAKITRPKMEKKINKLDFLKLKDIAFKIHYLEKLDKPQSARTYL